MARSMRTLPADTGGPRYIFAPDEPVRIKNSKYADAQAIGEALAQVTALNNGYLSPYAAVDAARSPESPLHPHFEWNDATAAEQHRLDQARALIRMIRIVDDDRDEPPRAFLSVREDNGGVSYRSIGDIITSVALQEAVLAKAEQDLRSFEVRYRNLTDVCQLVREARERVASRRSRGRVQDEARP